MAEEWVNVKDELPTKYGKYLVIEEVFGKAMISLCFFSNDLYSVDHYDFAKYRNKKDKRGFYEYNGEFGYNVVKALAWMPIPEIPIEYKKAVLLDSNNK